MNEEALNMEIRKFLKKVGISSQREMEKAINSAAASGKLQGDEHLKVTMHLAIPAIGLAFDVNGAIVLEK